MTNLVKVCAVEDLQTNMGVGALVKGEQIALFKLANGVSLRLVILIHFLKPMSYHAVSLAI